MTRVRTTILISGRGSNMAALIEAAAPEAFPAVIAGVVSNRPDAAGLARAAEAGLPTCVVDHRRLPDREKFETVLEAALADLETDLICLAGFMRVLTPAFCARWRDRILNIHPSLLPCFPGLDTHARALAAGVAIHGCTVHTVTADLDAGPIVAQAAVPVLPGDTAEALEKRVRAAEHQLYPHALRLVTGGIDTGDHGGDRMLIAPLRDPD